MAPSTASSRCSKRRHACWEPDRRRLDAGVAATSRGQAGVVHGARGDSDSKCREPRRSRPASRGAGRVAARRDSGGTRDGAGPGVRGGHRGGRTAASGRCGEHGPPPDKRHAHFCRQMGQGSRPLSRRQTILLGERNVGTIVFEPGRPARVEDYSDSSPGSIGAASHEMGIRSSVGSPIIVRGRSRVRRPLQGIWADRAPRWHRGGWRHARHDQSGWRRHNAAHPHPAQAVNAESWRPRQLASRPGLILHPQELLADAAASSYAQAPAAQAIGTTASCSCGPWGFEPAVRTPVASQRAVHQLRRPRAHASRCITVLSWC
jgi:hypothetical protein